ncbi:MAG: hypothetical protein PW788_09025 [Micavibrio sp.]|nr:hypothetical protein [Micavibrio sp.]
MRDQDKNSLDENQPPQPPAAPKVLHPLFGTYFSSETYSTKGKDNVITFQHLEAHLDDPVKKTWTVSRVVTTSMDSFYSIKKQTTTRVHQAKAKTTFKDAVGLLDAFEKECKAKPAAFNTLYPDGEAMGFVHFRAFAEREGYIFDTQGKPHARPDAAALPLGGTFAQEDIARANSHLARPADEFDNNGPASKLPNSHFLLDKFTKAARQDDYDTGLAGLRALAVLDRFVDHVAQAEQKLQEYCKTYLELGKGDLIDEADSLLEIASASLRQLKAYGVDTKEYESFVLQCQISCHVLHAEGLYDLMNKGKGDFDSTEAVFKERVQQALDAFKKIDSSEAGHRTLQNMIVQTAEPKVPAAIGDFVKKYRSQRDKMAEKKPAPGHKPPSI